MKFQILQENFEKAVGITSRFANTKAQLPILGNILISARKTKIYVSSTNLEISASVQVGAKIEKEGEVSVPAKVIYDLISNMPKETLEVDSEKEQMKISSNGFSSTVLGIDPTDFPKVPSSLNDKNAISLPKDKLSESLSKVSFATSTDETRPILTGVLFVLGRELSLVATDGFRLSMKKIHTDSSFKETRTVVIPKSVLSEIGRGVFDSEEVFFDLEEKEKQVLFGVGDTVLTSRLLEGDYPDYKKIIPKESSVKVWIDKEEFLRAVKLASIFARESANVIKIKVLKDSLKVVAESGQAGSQETKVDAKVEKGGGEFEIAFNFRYLEDFVHSVSGEEIEMGFTDPNSAGIFKDTTDTEYLHLIMPVKI